MSIDLGPFPAYVHVAEALKTSSRQASDTRAAATLLFATDQSRRATVDIGAPISTLGESAVFRVDAVAHHGEIECRDGTETDRWGAAPALALGRGTPTRLHVSCLHQSDDIRADYGLSWFAGRPAPARSTHSRSSAHRVVLFDLDRIIQTLHTWLPGDVCLVDMSGHYHDLSRLWADL
jgi:outer membrane receptor for monomeric catechols